MYLGVGDLGGMRSSINNKKLKSYVVWSAMLDRCYSESSKINHPSYEGCTVCEEWLFYPAFLEWITDNYKEGFHLDKDLKILGSKTYSPDSCSFIPAEINSLTISCKASRGGLPQGVAMLKPSGLYSSRVREYGKTINIGCFKCKYDAFKAYKERKLMYIIKVANSAFARGDICEQVFNNLINWEIKNDK